MPKTKKLFDWEVYENGEFIDIISMKRSELDAYKKANPTHILKEISYLDDGRDDTRESNSQKNRNIFSIRISKRRR